jgi:apolipoprotein D and lipocalin family protein
MRREEMSRYDVGGRTSVKTYFALFLSHVFAFFVPTPQLFAQVQDVKPVPQLDLDRYLGVWYEIAAIPQYFQRNCVRDVQATYAKAENALIEVRNECTTESGEKQGASGRARMTDPAITSKLEVTFVRLFGDWRFWIGGDYWVIGLDEDYRWAVVGHPSRKYAWVLSRTRTQDATQWARIDGALTQNGYDRCTLLISPQTEGDMRKRPLCER